MPLPGDFTLRLAPDLRRPVPDVLIGGAPVRVLRLTPGGAALIDRWGAGQPVGEGRAARTLAARLVEAGMADPCPPARSRPPGGSAGSVSACVVVPVRDDPAGLEVTLERLGATAPGVPVVVVDDGSEPAVSEPVMSAGGLVVRRASAGGPAAARNTGLGRIDDGTEVVVFVDAGCAPDAAWLETLLPHFADPGLAAIAPRVRSRAPAGTRADLARYEDAHSPLDLGPTGGPVLPGARVPYVPTAVLAVRVSALRELDGFDEALRFGEDVDLIWRLQERGWRVRYEPAATATHPARSDLGRWLRQRYDYGRSATPLAARHGRAVAPLTVSPWSLAGWCLVGLGRPLPALAIGAMSAEALARRAGGQRRLAGELRRLAYLGNLRAGSPIGMAIRRAWLPPAAGAAGLIWVLGGRRSRGWLVGTGLTVLAGPGLADWWAGRGERGVGRGVGPPLGPLRWLTLRLADDLAYQAGVWDGVVRGRSIRALLPRW